MSYNYSQNEYDKNTFKQYAVVIYLPDRLDRFVTPLRERFDPDYDLVTSHITLVFPWETKLPLVDLTAILADEVRQFAPIQVQLESVGDFYPETPLLYWSVAPNQALDRLYRELYARLDQPLPFKKLCPHVTVAKEISPHRVLQVKDQIATYLPKDSFEVAALDLISPIVDDHWASVRTFPLAQQ